MKNFEDFVKMVSPRLEKQYEVYKTPLKELVGKKVVSIVSGWGGGPGIRGVVTEIAYKDTPSSGGAKWGNDYIVISKGGERMSLASHENYWNEFIFI